MSSHKHHIIPRHMGGSNHESNIVVLSVEEHAEAHRKLYEEHGKWQDKIAADMLSGQIKSPDGSRKIKIFYSKAFLNPTLLSSNKDQRVKTHQRGILV